jgi:glucosamine-6-phosphate deaminase
VCPCRPLCSPKNTHILDGEADDLYKECEDYEAAIKAAGGIDLFLGGIGAGEWDVPR